MSDNDTKNIIICEELKFKFLSIYTILSLLIEAASKLEVLELLSVKPYNK